jgi:hypothetical protein
MKNFQASAVERRIIVNNDFASHPMEAGWASEAIFFLIVEEMSDNTDLNASVQISADGINWIDEGSTFPKIDKPGHYFAKATCFGNWLRVNAKLNGSNPQMKVSVHLHLKG